MTKNDIFAGICERLGTGGEGIVRADGVTVFVPYMLPEEKGNVKILKIKDNIAYGKLEELVIPAEDRVRPRCGVFGRCGGCQLQHMKYRSQIRFKRDLVEGTLKKIGNITFPVSPCERSEKEYGYRNKLQLPIGRIGEENAVGFYAERSHRIVPTSECPLHPEWAGKLIAAVLGFMEKCGLDGYDEETGKGQLRHIVVRELKNKFIVTLVATVREIKGIDYLLFLLSEIFPEYSFYLNFNDSKTNVIFGKEFTLLKGKGFYECTENGITFEAGASTFVQVNEGVRSKLYERVVSLVEKGETVFDCYAGGGLLTAMLAKKCGKAYGIEVVPEASACAENLKERNRLEEQMTNICGTVEDELPKLLERERNAVVVLDPPRAGVEREVLKTLLRCAPKKIVLVSCNPATLARDMGILLGTLTETEGGELVKAENPRTVYEITLIEPYDMFPQTKHVETLAVLVRKE